MACRCHFALSILAALAAGAPAALSQDTATVRITKADCDQLVKHVPAPDVAYQPGVDVNGDPVAPADLNGGYQVALPDSVLIEIDIDTFDRFGIPPNPDSYTGTVVAGFVEYRDERFYFNGQPLLDEEQAALAERCQEIARQGE